MSFNSLHTGPMWSGKTTGLIKEIQKYRLLGKSVLVLKPSIDTRSGRDRVTSHDGLSIVAYDIEPGRFSEDGRLGAALADVIAVDEVQFLEPPDIEWLIGLERQLIGAGLSRDCFGNWFGEMETIVEESDIVFEHKATCVLCDVVGVASHTQRLDSQGMPVTSGDVVEVGGEGRYEPRCSNCWVGPND